MIIIELTGHGNQKPIAQDLHIGAIFFQINIQPDTKIPMFNSCVIMINRKNYFID